MSIPARFVAVATVAVLASIVPTARATGGALPPGTSADPTLLDLQVAVARSPGGAAGVTRWSRLTVAGTASVMWLVPARPGASLDYATEAWLDALDEATAPRIRPPSYPPPCELGSDAERVATWSTIGTKRFPKNVTVLATEADARAHAAARDFKVAPAMATRIKDAYAKGWALVALELDGLSTTGSTTPTVRVTDDGGPGAASEVGMLPLALTGSASATARVTAFVVGEGGAELGITKDVDRASIVWKASGSTYGSQRSALLASGAGAVWLRESASHDVLFSEQAVPLGKPVPSLVAAYFRGATGGPRVSCEADAIAASAEAGAVGRTCAGGSLASVPGGQACAPTTGAVDPKVFTCGSGVDDLALALAGSAPKRVVATRLSGIVPAGTFGTDLVVGASSAMLEPVQPAARFDTCPVAVPPGGGSSTPPPPSSGTPETSVPGTHTRYEDGCTGTSTIIVYEDTGREETVADEGCGASSTGTTTSPGDDGESCSGDSTGTSSGTSSDTTDKDSSESRSDDANDEGWDKPDDDSSDDSSSDDSCSSKKGSSSSSSSSSTSSSSSSSGSSDMKPSSTPVKTKASGVKPSSTGAKKKTTTMRARSPVSRYALLLVAIVLPLRRRLRNAKRVF